MNINIDFLKKLIDRIHLVNPKLFYIITDYIFIPCYNDIIQNYKYVKILGRKPVNAVEYEAFRDNKYLKFLIVDKKVKRIYDYAFSNCKNLKAINLQYGLETIGARSFEDCFSLKKIIMPKTVLKINNFAFKSCLNLKSLKLNDDILIMGFGILLDCKSLESITIPKNLKRIESICFKNCSSLKELHIPKNIENINFNAFNGCSGIKKIIIENNNKLEIEDSAFSLNPNTFKFNSLENLKIPKKFRDDVNYIFLDVYLPAVDIEYY
jgi:hypothetical protein